MVQDGHGASMVYNDCQMEKPMDMMKGVSSTKMMMELVTAKKIPPRGDAKNAITPIPNPMVGNISDRAFLSSSLDGGRLYPM